MKIKYVHMSAPDEVKVHDTKASLLGCCGLLHFLEHVPTQDEWDRQTLERMERDLEQGHILSFEVI